MHLKSSRGPIDVLVCPETEETWAPPSPCPLRRDSHPTGGDPVEATPPHQTLITTTQDNMSSAGAGTSGLMSVDEKDVSLSSIADVTSDDLECLLQYGSGGGLDQLDPGTLLPSFETLSPPLQDGDFNFGLDPSEGIGDLFDL